MCVQFHGSNLRPHEGAGHMQKRLFHVLNVNGRTILNVAAFLLLLLLSSPEAVVAQTAGTGALTGTVTDPSGGVVPGVTVIVTSTNTGQTRTAVTQSNGKYLVPLLPPDLYKVKFQARISKQQFLSKSESTLPKRPP